jgi:hypothetical protein
MTRAKTFLCGMAALLLAACDFPSFNREAGDMDLGSFGNATMENAMLATTPQPAPYSAGKYNAPAAGGTLNGKYAAIIMQTYHTEQAVRPHPSNTAVVSQTTGE